MLHSTFTHLTLAVKFFLFAVVNVAFLLPPSVLRYIPVGLLERVPQKINERPPYYMGRNYLETLMASQNVEDWIRIR